MPFDSLFQATPKLDSPSLPRDYENTNQLQSKQRLFFSEKAGDEEKKTKRFGAKRRISNPGNNDRVATVLRQPCSPRKIYNSSSRP